MGIFSNVTADKIEKNEDRLGGSFVVPTAIYTGELVQAFAGQSAGGARNITLLFKHSGGKEYRETVYFTNKNGENFYEKEGKKYGLPGFHIINDICLILTGKPLADQDTEEKTVNVYDFDEKKELPKAVDVLVDILGQEISFAIQETTEDVNEKGDDGKYVPTGKTRQSNNIEKVFHTETKMTVSEAERGLSEGEFWGKWSEKNDGQVRDNTKKVDGKAGRPGRATPPQEGGSERKSTSLFGKR